MGVGGGVEPRAAKSRFNFDFRIQTDRRQSSVGVMGLHFHIPLYARLTLNRIRSMCSYIRLRLYIKGDTTHL
jgi:hypothetical protein